MDRAGGPPFVPLSPVSSHSDSSLGDREVPDKPLPAPPTSKKARTSDVEVELPALQVANGEPTGLDPVGGEDLDPSSFDLVMPVDQDGAVTGKYELEERSELLFSSRHLQGIFDDSAQLHQFSNFLYQHRPSSVPLLTYYLEALKALRAIEYSNAVLRTLGPLTDFDFTHEFFQAQPTANQELQAKAHMAFEIMAREDLPMYITHVWIQTVTVSIRHRIMGTPHHAAEGLAEVFCLTDPSRHDNPIVFMTEEFNRTTQYGVDYIIGRNCRFLQGPTTNPFSVKRIREKLEAGVEHYETFLNYRRDGTPFMNLLMLAPLYDSRGAIRYFIGAQVDVSGLARGCYGLGALKRIVDDDEAHSESSQSSAARKDEFSQLAEMLGPREIEVVRDCGGDMHRPPFQSKTSPHHEKRASTSKTKNDNSLDGAHNPGNWAKHRVVLNDPDSRTNSPPAKEEFQPPGPSAAAASLAIKHNGRLTGVYENYLLVRPYPSLRILFTSPSMRVPGILQSPLLDRIGGSARMRDQLVQALADGQGVTAKVKWLNVSHRVATYGSRPPRKKMQYNHPLEAHLDVDDDSDSLSEPEPPGRSRWLHCTPLIGSNRKVGVWMIVIVDDETDPTGVTARHGNAPTIDHRRTDTTVSQQSVAVEDAKHPYNGRLPEGKLKIRARRSSETLGSPPAATTQPPVEEDASATKIIHNQHSFSGLRAPKPTLRSTGVPARFFCHNALSRASTSGGPGNGTAPFVSDSIYQQRDDERANTLSRAESRPEPPLPLWLSPPGSPVDSRMKREQHQVQLHQAISKPAPDNRGVVRSHNDDDGETSSIHSRGSAFTVRIEED